MLRLALALVFLAAPLAMANAEVGAPSGRPAHDLAVRARPANGVNKMITHVVFFWLKNPESQADRDRLMEGIRSLGAIEEVRSLKVGVPAATEARDVVDHSFAVSEILTFDNAADQRAYQEHPIHQRFVAEYGHLWDRVTVYDITDAG